MDVLAAFFKKLVLLADILGLRQQRGDK